MHIYQINPSKYFHSLSAEFDVNQFCLAWIVDLIPIGEWRVEGTAVTQPATGRPKSLPANKAFSTTSLWQKHMHIKFIASMSTKRKTRIFSRLS